MPYDEKLAGRVRRLLSDRNDVTERTMFGGLTFMIAGHMCCGVNRDELIVRVRPDDVDGALARPMDFTGRPMAAKRVVAGAVGALRSTCCHRHSRPGRNSCRCIRISSMARPAGKA